MVKSSIRPVLFKYAFACIEVFSEELQKETINSLFEKIVALKESRLSVVTEIPYFFNSLFKLLVFHKRSEFFFPILDLIFLLWCERNKFALIFVYSVLPLSPEQRAKIENYVRRNSEYLDVHFIYKIDTTLIAGIRIESYSESWDYSLKTRLEKARKIVCNGGLL